MRRAVLRRKAHAKAMTHARWADHRVARAEDRAQIHAEAAAEVGTLSHRELLLVGAALYWAEGTKAKPWRPYDWRVTWTNSDPGLVQVFLRFLEAIGYSRHDLKYSLSIHMFADVDAAKLWWTEQLELRPGAPIAVSLKRHNPSPVRYKTGDDYHGCVVVRVPRPTRLYWRIEGIMKALMGER